MTEQGEATSRRLRAGRRRFAESLFSDLSPEAFAGFDAGLSQVLDRLRRLLGD